MKQISNDRILFYGLRSSFKDITFCGGVGLLLLSYWLSSMYGIALSNIIVSVHRYVNWYFPLMVWT